MAKRMKFADRAAKRGGGDASFNFGANVGKKAKKPRTYSAASKARGKAAGYGS